MHCIDGHSCAGGPTQPAICLPGTIAPPIPVHATKQQLAARAQCFKCASGKYQRAAGKTACELCEQGYCPEGSAHPISCEIGADLSHTTVTLRGAANVTSCVCKPGYYDSSNATGDRINCLLCPSGTACDAAGFTLHTLPIAPGHYRPSTRLQLAAQISRGRALLSNGSTPAAWFSPSIDVRRCPDAAVNCSNAPVCPHTTSGCRGGGDSDALCREGLGGIFCRTCLDRNDGTRVYYTGATDGAVAQCTPCKDTLPLTVGMSALVVVLAFMLWVTGRSHYIRKRRRSASVRDWTANLWRAVKPFKPLNKCKILLSFYMIATRVDSVYEVSLPYKLKRLIAALSMPVDLGFSEVGTPLECLGLRGYRPQLAFLIVMPIVLVPLIVMSAAGRLCFAKVRAGAQGIKQTRHEREDTHFDTMMLTALPWVLRFFFFVYPLITNTAFDAFPCYKLCFGSDDPCPVDEVRQFLKADVSIEC